MSHRPGKSEWWKTLDESFTIPLPHMSSRAASTTAEKWTLSIHTLDRRLEAGENVPLSQGQDLQKRCLEEEENLRIYRRAKDIWLRLTAPERNAMRAKVIKDDPYLKKEDDFLIEGRCIGLIKEQLRQSKK